jgi:hypothetical protein
MGDAVMSDEPKYNWDIATTEPPLAHKALQTRFHQIDKLANAEKSSSRKRGYIAVALGAVSLLTASAASLLESSYEVYLSQFAAIAGVCSIAIGVFGVLHAGAKRKWLELRYQTERLRQFHFQSAIALLPELLAQQTDPTSNRFTAQRDELFKRFSLLHLDVAAGDRLGAILRDADEEGWMFGDLPATPPADNAAFRAFEREYRHYRLAAQIDYCDKKLNRRQQASMPKTPAEQAITFGAIALFCILGATMLHVVTAGAPDSIIPHEVKRWLNVGVLWLAVAVLGVRALEEGLRPQREVERYRQYRSALRSIGARLDASDNPAEKIAAMKQLELISFEEMVNFLKDNDQARFVM